MKSPEASCWETSIELSDQWDALSMDTYIIPYFIKICTEQIGPGSNASDLCMGDVC